jgi:hypothetical protein
MSPWCEKGDAKVRQASALIIGRKRSWLVEGQSMVEVRGRARRLKTTPCGSIPESFVLD